MKNSSNSKVMVITGASSGIGRATALAWAKKGGSVVLAARSKEVLEEVAALCEEQGGRALVVQTDTTREEQVNALAAEAVAYFGKIDVWVNGAGLFIVMDEIVAPLLGLTSGPKAYPWQAHARGLAGHLALGATTDASLKLINKAVSA